MRERYAYQLWWARFVVPPLTLVSCVMTRRMLRGVQERAGRRQHMAL